MFLKDEYRKIQNSIALDRLIKIPEMPNPNLAIGDDEFFRPHSVKVFTDFYSNMPTTFIEDFSYSKVERVGKVGDGIVVKETDFFYSDFYLGDEINGGY